MEFTPVSFRDGPDYRELVDTETQYLVRLERVEDYETKLGESLRWHFAIHNQTDGTPVLKDDETQLVITRVTSPKAGPMSRTRRFVHALVGRELSKSEFRALIESGTLAQRLQGQKALAFIEFEAKDGNEYPRINELLPVPKSAGATANGAQPPSPNKPDPAALAQRYTEIFGDEDGKSAKSTDDRSDLPF